MADSPKFLAVLKAVDEVTGPISSITSKLKGLGRSVQSDFANPWKQAMTHASSGGGLAAVGHHLSGIGTVLKSAFGELSPETAEGAHKVGSEVERIGNKAEKSGDQVRRSIHPHIYDALSGHVRLLRGHFGTLSASIGEVSNNLTEFLPMLAGLGAAGSVAGLFEITNQASESFSQLSSYSKQAGVSIKTYAALSLAAKENDVPVENLRTSLFNLGKIMGGALAGSNKNAAMLFRHLGIALKDSHGKILTVTEALPKLAEAFKNTTNGPMQKLMAQTLFGGRSGAMLLPILMEGKKGLEEYFKAEQKIGYVPTKNAAKKLEDFHKSWIQLGEAVDGLKMKIGSSLGPVLKPIVDDFTKWVGDNRAWLGTKIADGVKGLATALKTMHIKEVIEDFGRFAKYTVHIAGALGPLPTVIGALTLALGSPLLHAIMRTVNDLKVLVTWALTAARAIGSTLVEALKSAGTAMKGMDATFHATTIGRAAALAFDIYDFAHSGRKVNLSGKQKKLLESWHLKTGQALTAAQREQLGPLSTGTLQTGSSFDQRARNWLSSLVGLGGSSPSASPGLASPYDAKWATRPVGKIESHVYFHGAPAGTRVTTNGSGAVAPPRVSMDYALRLGAADPLGYGY